MEENAREATRKTKQSGKQPKYQNIPYQNPNFISHLAAIIRAKQSLPLRLRSEIKRIIVHLDEGVRGKRKTKNSLSERDKREYLFCGHYESTGVRISQKQDTL